VTQATPTPTPIPPGPQSLDITLRLLEFVALLLPVLAITTQALLRVYDADADGRRLWEKLAFITLGVALVALVSAGSSLISVVGRVAELKTVSDSISTLQAALFLFTLGVAALFIDFYATGGDDEDTERVRPFGVGAGGNKTEEAEGEGTDDGE
jgi:hypothetical protein